MSSDEQRWLNEQGGCAVDWSWLIGEKVASVSNSLDTLRIVFESGLTFQVSARLWQGQPFVSWKPDARPALPPK